MAGGAHFSVEVSSAFGGAENIACFGSSAI